MPATIMLVVGIVSLPTSVNADDSTSGFYIVGGAGTVFHNRYDEHRVTKGGKDNWTFYDFPYDDFPDSFPSGSALSGRVGYRFDNMHRTELELTIRHNPMDAFEDTFTGEPDVRNQKDMPGKMLTHALMLTGYVDIPLQTLPEYFPVLALPEYLSEYNATLSLGVGAGFVHANAKTKGLPDVPLVDGSGTANFGRSRAVAWLKAAQFRAGLMFDLTPNLSVGPEYTFLAVEGARQKQRNWRWNPPDVEQTRADMKPTSSHTIMFTLRYNLSGLFDQ